MVRAGVLVIGPGTPQGKEDGQHRIALQRGEQLRDHALQDAAHVLGQIDPRLREELEQDATALGRLSVGRDTAQGVQFRVLLEGAAVQRLVGVVGSDRRASLDEGRVLRAEMSQKAD